jgi:uncharacterized protein YbjT (DUF2867 family)
MPEKKIIAVVGATGAQGGGLARAILADSAGGFAVRALTRKPDSDQARALAEEGAEIVAADIDDAVSVRRAFTGAYGAFCVTNFWEHFSPARELSQAAHMSDAAKEAGLKHVVWSTLEDTRRWVPLNDDRMPTLQEKYKVPHFDAKGEADHLFTERGVPTTFLVTSFYWDNFVGFGLGPKRGPGGVLMLGLPMGDKKLPGIAVADIGKCAYGVFKAGPGLAGQRIGIAGEHLSGEEMAHAFGAALREEVRYQAMEPADYRALGFPGADDLGNMFQFKRDFDIDYRAARDPAVARRFNPELMSFADWLDRRAAEIPVA